MEKKRQASFRIAVASLVLSAGLLVVGWYDYTSTRNELLTLLVDQAASMRQAVAAAASLGEAASAQTQSAIAARLLDNARLLRMLDARGGLTQAQLDEVARANRLFRVTVLSAMGERELSSGTGGPPPGAGRGFGPGAGGGVGRAWRRRRAADWWRTRRRRFRCGRLAGLARGALAERRSAPRRKR
jgi:hypothetical protein